MQTNAENQHGRKKMHLFDSTEASRTLVNFAIAPPGSVPGTATVAENRFANNQSELSKTPFWGILGTFTGLHVTTVARNS